MSTVFYILGIVYYTVALVHLIAVIKSERRKVKQSD